MKDDKLKDIFKSIEEVDHKLTWGDIEKLAKKQGWLISRSKKGYKVYIKNSVWSVHLEHRISDELKQGIIAQLKKVLIKENIL